MIYILDEKTPFAKLKAQIDKTKPLTIEEVVDLIISKIDGQDESEFNSFKSDYTKLAFNNSTNKVKYDTFLNDLMNLENCYGHLGSWKDPREMRSDLMANLFSFHLVDEKTVLYNRQIKDWVKTGIGYYILCRKKEYLNKAIEILKQLIANKIEFSDLSEIIAKEQQIGSVNSSNEKAKRTVSDKKIPEKWYALLHMILVRMDKVERFKKITDKKAIIEYGKSNYPFKGTGQGFYKEIQRINDSPSIYNYIHKYLKKDFRKWKNIIIKISGDDIEVKDWIDKNLK